MNADELSQQQYRALKNKLEPMADYLFRLRLRMQRRGFPETDPLMEQVAKASDAVGNLRAEVFCRAMDGQGLKPRRRKR